MIPLYLVLLTSSYASSCVFLAVDYDRHLHFSDVVEEQRKHSLKMLKMIIFVILAIKITDIPFLIIIASGLYSVYFSLLITNLLLILLKSKYLMRTTASESINFS